MTRFQNYLLKTFVINEKALLVSRVLIAISCIWNIISYAGTIFLLSPDYLFFPPGHFPTSIFPINIFALNNSAPFIYTFMGLGILAAVLFAVGVKAKFMLPFLWLINASLRNQVALDSRSFETLLQASILWMMFFPHAPISRLWNKEWHPRLFSGLPVIGWYFQICLLYVFSFFYKIINPEWLNLNALELILSKAAYQTSMLEYFPKEIFILKSLTFFTLAIEILLPFIILFFFRFPKIRNLIVISYIAFHFIIPIFVNVGMFTPMTIAFWVALLALKTETENKNEYFSYSKFQNSWAFILITLIFAGNLYGTPDTEKKGHYASGTGLLQVWAMFSTKAHTNPINLWLGSSAHFIDQSEGSWDIVNNRPDDFASPLFQISSNTNYIYRALISKLGFMNKKEAEIYLALAPQYFCNEWNSSNERKIGKIELFLVRNHFRSQPKEKQIRKRTLITADCL